MTPQFQIQILTEADEFLKSLEEPVRVKIIYNLRKARSSKDPELFKKLDDNIWEFRTLYNKKHYRLLAFWDKRDKANTLVICTHGVIKKTSKMPSKEVQRAKDIRDYYFEQKE